MSRVTNLIIHTDEEFGFSAIKDYLENSESHVGQLVLINTKCNGPKVMEGPIYMLALRNFRESDPMTILECAPYAKDELIQVFIKRDGESLYSLFFQRFLNLFDEPEVIKDMKFGEY